MKIIQRKINLLPEAFHEKT